MLEFYYLRMINRFENLSFILHYLNSFARQNLFADNLDRYFFSVIQIDSLKDLAERPLAKSCNELIVLTIKMIVLQFCELFGH
jgi:hypothetical protein